MRKFVMFLLTLVMLVFVPAESSFASGANTGGLTPQQIKEIKNGLASLGVDTSTQNSLIRKLENGQLWDSMDPQKVAAVKSQLVATVQDPYKRYVFPDGSVIVSGIQTNPTSGNVQPNLSGGSSYCGTGYCNFNGVKVYRTDGAVTASYYANYSIVNGVNNPDSLSSVYSWNITVAGGTYTFNSLSVLIPQEVVGTGGYAAQGELSFSWQLTQGLAGGSDRLDIYVGQDTAWQSASW